MPVNINRKRRAWHANTENDTKPENLGNEQEAKHKKFKKFEKMQSNEEEVKRIQV